MRPACLGPDGSAGKVERALRVVNGRWKLAILFNLFVSPRLRFHELRSPASRTACSRCASASSKKIESSCARCVGEKPLEVDYALMPRGRAFRPILRTLRDSA